MYLGLDLGTSGLKALLIDEDQRVVAEATGALSVNRLKAAWAEQQPRDWIGAAESVLGTLSENTDLSAVRGIGLSGQMHGATMLDAGHDPVAPCILWNDTRAAEEAAAMDTDPRWREITGNIVFPGFTAPKLAWLRAHRPEEFERIAMVLLPKDYLRLWMTGEAVSDMSDASGTSWLATGERIWSPALVEATGLPMSAMPAVVEGSKRSASLRSPIAERFGFEAGIPVAGGGGDNPAAAVGTGIVGAGDAFVSLGTSGVLFAATDTFRPEPGTAVHTFCHALPGRWLQGGVILAATDALNWFARLVGDRPAALTGGLGPLQAPGNTVFLPYLGGERTPLNDAAIRGAFLGLGHATDREAATRAVLEGVTFALADCADALRGAGTRIDRLIATGGGARSDYWLSALATALGQPIERPQAGDFGAALGAARLAMMAAGDADENVATPPPTADIIEPDAALRDAYEEGHDRYRRIRDAVKELS